ncbi:DUF5686 and carboxypeptidase regulatory-like domain-containing protein [Chryseobacterium sp. Ch-15]|uniref:Carboxypeptidase-like regulatory domain-containing protein n=1 Tax=Chryseobacterium muglaense TaxID=2893752 RepID=A0A9Q3YT61_9FLAO|nr:DUF5686 and carboxypeptidase-like regulatory domain-containing protein [Chryseobacterium muglaense]MBD3903313.1 carboxypeptidase-like regulatory domain-containing protein [Chryseobacterium muglaense]MCC9036143.1 DUF5686 and carboxypeptidase regulatory-like domain-containing protein [Chryseobacterium muglaense]MCM2553282.1 DUF5686 and carboxypeptidase regulatory-like domain-containing protein [Chryseobacterium muglaense]
MYLNKWAKILFATILVVFSNAAHAQMKITGTVNDSESKKPLINVVVSVSDNSIKTVTDENGDFVISVPEGTRTLNFSKDGFKMFLGDLGSAKEQRINVALKDRTTLVEEVVIRAQKKKYRNKDNPAVELIRKVVQNKQKNRFNSYQNLSFEEYEKIQFSLSNKYEKLSTNRLVRKNPFLKENIDTTKIAGKAILPLYMEEVLSDNFQTFSPNKSKKIIKGEKKVTLNEDFFDNAGLGTYLKHIYQKIDIYDDNITLLTNQFLSPIADSAPTFYKYYIRDTIVVNDDKMINLSFTPRNKSDFLFSGNLLVSLDGNYAVQGLDMRINKNTNVNWVKEMDISQEFEKNELGKYIITKSKITADFGISKTSEGGIYGERTLTYKKYSIDQPIDESVFSGDKTVTTESATTQDQTFWDENRHETITESEKKVYVGIEKLQNSKSFKRTMNIFTMLFAGYLKVSDYVEVGPFNTFYSFTPVEGFRLRFGGRTTPSFNKKIYLESYAAYGFKDEKWKYYVGGTYSLSGNNRFTFPARGINVNYQQDTKIPGQELQFIQEDNFLLSFKRGVNDKWLYNNIYKVEYYQEFLNHISYKVGYKNWKQMGAGGISFSNDATQEQISGITSSEIYTEFRWAPNEEFYQGKLYRFPLPNKYPVFTLRGTIGMNKFLKGDYNYKKITANIYKRFYLSQLGFSDVILEGGYTFGKVPYPLLDIHRANQSYSYQLQSYNLMNFLEFVGDQYASLQYEHTFNGFIFNKIPLLKKTKFREFISFKMLYGGLRDENTPNGTQNDLMRFPTDDQGLPTTFSLEKEPYMEGSVGIGNIFKFFRVDLVRRFTYLDNPNVSKSGVRFRFKFDF